MLYMQNRLFRMFIEEKNIDSKKADKIFITYGIWKYIEDCYDLLHLNGDDAAMEDIDLILKKKGALI